MNPMNMRSRASGARSRTSVNPHASPTSGNAIAATPKPPWSVVFSARPTGPAASSQTDRTASPASTTSPIPTASRACGDRICRVEARRGLLLDAVDRLDAEDAGFLPFPDFGFALAAGFRPRLRPDFWLDDGRDDVRRDGEVFVAIGR